MSDAELNADAEREAEFWRTHPRDDARPDETDTGTTALIAQAERMSLYVQRGGPDDGTVYDRLAAALKRLGEELEDAEDRRGNEYLKLEDTVAEQAATIAAVMKWRHDWFNEPVEGVSRAAHLRRLDAILDGPPERII